MRLLPLIILPLLVAACHSREPEPQPVATSSPTPSETATPEAAPSPIATPTPDLGALEERKDPERVLRFYADALAARDWAAAARAWGKDSGVTPATLKAAYDRARPPALTFGKGRQEGAAGSLFYEAPVTLRFGPADIPQRGTLTLRRVNDIDGATPEQLRWHIERSTIGASSPPP